MVNATSCTPVAYIISLLNRQTNIADKQTLVNTVSFGTALSWTLVFHFEKSSPQPKIKVCLEFRFSFRSVLLDFQSFTEKHVFECAFAYPMILFLSYLVKNSMDRVSVICK